VGALPQNETPLAARKSNARTNGTSPGAAVLAGTDHQQQRNIQDQTSSRKKMDEVKKYIVEFSLFYN
jgi:hypothetical protein